VAAAVKKREGKMRKLISMLLVLVVTGSALVNAQVAVFDVAVTTRNALTAALKEYHRQVQEQQHSQLRRMAQRLSLFTNLDKYVLSDVPRWRIHDFETFLYANGYHAALNYGDAGGTAYSGVIQSVLEARELLSQLTPTGRRAVSSRLATVDLADAAAISATHSSGLLRYNGRRELQAIDALQAHVVDPSNEQSATAVLDKISGAVLIGARQRQARVQLLAGVVEQLLVDNKRARDTETAAINMQIVTWRDRRAANEAFIAGTSDALGSWRQP
jgi:hypothetical protein